MELVRSALGPDAIILSTEEDSRGVVVMAARDNDLAAAPHPDVPGPQQPDLAPARNHIARVLAHHRLPSELAARLEDLTAPMTDPDPSARMAAALSATLPFAAGDLAVNSRPILLVGPPGAGKSATAARIGLAARMAGRSFMLATLDGSKAGALAQAKGFAESLGAELEAIVGAEQLRRLLRKQPQGKCIVIDTPGHSPFVAEALADLGRLCEASAAEPIMVMAAGGDPNEAGDIAAAFARLGARRQIVTRFDVTRRLGGVILAASETGMALAAASNSALIAQCLHELSPAFLAAQLFEAAGESCNASWADTEVA